MPRVDEETRRERLNRILRLLLRHPLGLREVEIAQRMGLPRRTVNDYLWSGELTGVKLHDKRNEQAKAALERVLKSNLIGRRARRCIIKVCEAKERCRQRGSGLNNES